MSKNYDAHVEITSKTRHGVESFRVWLVTEQTKTEIGSFSRFRDAKAKARKLVDDLRICGPYLSEPLIWARYNKV